MRLGEEVSSDELLQEGSEGGRLFDSVVMATGVVPRSLVGTVPGAEHPNVVSYLDVLTGKVKVGERVAVIGAGGIGFDVAEYLVHHGTTEGGGGGGDGGGGGATEEESGAAAEESAGRDSGREDESVDTFMNKWGVDLKNVERGGVLGSGKDQRLWKSPRHVYLLQRSSKKHGSGLGKTTGWIHRAGLNHSGVEMLGGCTYDKIDENGHVHVTITTKDKKTKKVTNVEKRMLEVDHVIVCAGQVSLRELETPLKEKGMNVFRIGGSENAGDLDANRAFDQGTRLALKFEHAKPGDVYERPVGFQKELIDRIRAMNPTGAK